MLFTKITGAKLVDAIKNDSSVKSGRLLICLHPPMGVKDSDHKEDVVRQSPNLNNLYLQAIRLSWQRDLPICHTIRFQRNHCGHAANA